MDSEHEQRVLAKMAQLAACRGDYQCLHADLDQKRQAWWETNKDSLHLDGPLPRRAYTLLLLRYMGLDTRDVPVVYEDERTIVWRSFNFCPVLEACQRVGLDTRQVCREGTEQSVQNLIARLDVRLRFSRNYETGMRPYAAYCEESITVVAP
jgi:tRNA(adenine34) deaminase